MIATILKPVKREFSDFQDQYREAIIKPVEYRPDDALEESMPEHEYVCYYSILIVDSDGQKHAFYLSGLMWEAWKDKHETNLYLRSRNRNVESELRRYEQMGFWGRLKLLFGFRDWNYIMD